MRSDRQGVDGGSSIGISSWQTGIAESHAGWLQLVDSGVAAPKDVDTMIPDLIWLTDELERLVQRARAFVRPVFDEPDVAARLSNGGA